jgi:hypothetical protein
MCKSRWLLRMCLHRAYYKKGKLRAELGLESLRNLVPVLPGGLKQTMRTWRPARLRISTHLYLNFTPILRLVQLRIPRLPLYLPRRPFAMMPRSDWSRCHLAIHRRRGSQHHRLSFAVLSFVTLSVMSYLVPTHHDLVCSFPFGNHTTMIATRFCMLRRYLNPCPVSSPKPTARFLPA